MSDNDVDKPIEDKTIVTENKYRLCENMDCERYPPDWDFEEDTEENYEDGQQWLKCNKCDGYYNDDGLGDILFIQEEPHNQEAECDLCGKTEDIVQMKGCGQYLCGNGCDESDDEHDENESQIEDNVPDNLSNDKPIPETNNENNIPETNNENNIPEAEDNECDKIIEECKTMCNNYITNNIPEAEDETEDNKCDNIIEECKTMCNNSNTNKITCRSHFSNMMFSHICMIIPCIWWIRIDNPETMNAVLYSKLMSMVMIVAIIASYIYHYYNECVLCSAETTYNKFAILCLNIYMYLRNVSIFYIVPGFTLLYALHRSLEYSNSQNKDFYELCHPFCHYIAGVYIYYCVWNLNNAQQKICDTTPNNIIYNDIYSSVNYPEIRL